MSLNRGPALGLTSLKSGGNIFQCLNSILCNAKGCSELVKLELIAKQCMPLLLYGIKSFNLSATEIRFINSLLNMAYRKIFAFNKWESLKCLIVFLGRTDFSHTFQMRRILFLKKLEHSSNSVMLALLNFIKFKYEYSKVMTVGASTINIDSSVGTVRRMLFDHFESTIDFN